MATRSCPPEKATLECDQAPPVDSGPAFICTICWQHQPYGSKSKLLGTSARIVCRACWRAVLDLSICWVCGECIVRGDEVVSLGWCFWHKGCFGCLVCGTKLDVPGVVGDAICREGGRQAKETSGEWGRRGGSEDGVCAVGRSRCIGVELEEIPMCGVCGVETAGESTDRVMERGLETVTKFDGGLSRSRLDMLSEVKDERDGEMRLAPKLSARTTRRFRDATKTEDGLKSFSRCRSRCHMSEPLDGEELEPLLEDAADMGIVQDGSSDDEHLPTDTEMSNIGHPLPCKSPREREPSIVYVSIMDPAGEPPFKPTKTKPLPKWMNLLPSNVHKERERRAKDEARVQRKSHELEKRTASYSSGGSEDRGPGKVVPRSRATIPPARAQDSKPVRTDTPARLMMQSRAMISFDTVPKGDFILENNVSRAYRRSQTADSDYLTAPESAAGSLRSRPHTPFPRSPYPSASRPSLDRKECSSYFSHRPSINAQEGSVDDSSCGLVIQQPSPASPASPKSPEPPESSESGSSLSTLDSNVHFPSPLQSSEYIERYQPKKTPAAKFEKYIAGEAGPILNKIKRQMVGKQVLDAVEEEKELDAKGKGKILKTTVKELGLHFERKGLNQELKNLFT
ncbi:hypothetical protein BUE80_DR002507 [Diplocarpon rosae]|nr:hypothetical protein BUE80_DR002507 [Diplocarpon rosae]